jgi:hypothetical protein
MQLARDEKERSAASATSKMTSLQHYVNETVLLLISYTERPEQVVVFHKKRYLIVRREDILILPSSPRHSSDGRQSDTESLTGGRERGIGCLGVYIHGATRHVHFHCFPEIITFLILRQVPWEFACLCKTNAVCLIDFRLWPNSSVFHPSCSTLSASMLYVFLPQSLFNSNPEPDAVPRYKLIGYSSWKAVVAPPFRASLGLYMPLSWK